MDCIFNEYMINKMPCTKKYNCKDCQIKKDVQELVAQILKEKDSLKVHNIA